MTRELRKHWATYASGTAQWVRVVYKTSHQRRCLHRRIDVDATLFQRCVPVGRMFIVIRFFVGPSSSPLKMVRQRIFKSSNLSSNHTAIITIYGFACLSTVDDSITFDH